MSKNLTRKGLAFGAIVALGASLFSAAPAFAADELTLAPKTGTAYKTIAGEAFTLQTGLAPATPAGNTVQLKYSVTTAATLATTATAVNGAATTKVTAGQPTNTYVLKETATPTVGALQTLVLTNSGALATGVTETAAVTAFFDANNNDVLDSGEFSSAARTITWVSSLDVVANVTIAPVSVGDTTVSATLAFKDLNNSQIPVSHVGLYFMKNDGATTPTSLDGLTAGGVIGDDLLQSAAGTNRVTYSSTKDVFSGTTVAVTAVAITGTIKNNSVKVQALYKTAGAPGAVGAFTDKIGTAATLDAVARTINSIDADASGATGVAASTAVQAVPGTAGSLLVNASNVKGNTVKIVATVKDSATTPAVVANAALKVTVTPGTALSSSNSLTINGTAYTANLTAALDVTTDAAGQITLTVANATAITAGNYTFAIAGQNITNTVTVAYAAPTYTIYDVTDVAGAAGRTVVKAGTYTLNYRVVDQFGDAPAVAATATTSFRLKDTVTTTNAGTWYGALAADGTGSITGVPTATAGTSNHSVIVEKTTDAFANVTDLGATAVTTAVVVKATAAEATASKITLGNPVPGAGQVATTFAANVQTGSANLSSTAFSAFDGRFSKTAAPALAKGYITAPSATAGVWTKGSTAQQTANAALAAGSAKITIPVTVNDSTVATAAVDGASVTVAAKGFLFVATSGGKSVYGVDSLTFLADSGSTSVDVYSHVTGTQSVVFTSGSATATQKIAFTNYGTEATAVALGTLAAQAQAGSTVSVSAVVTDKWGNVVPDVLVAFSNTGAGYVQDTAAKLTDSKGAVTGRVIVLQNDLGTSYITATVGKTNAVLSADLASAKSVEFGLVDADVVAGGHRVFVNAEFAKGRTITVTIDGKRVYSKVQATDNAVELAFTQKKKGSHTVTVRISGGVVFTEKVTTN